jgi:hypothetical protein
LRYHAHLLEPGMCRTSGKRDRSTSETNLLGNGPGYKSFPNPKTEKRSEHSEASKATKDNFFAVEVTHKCLTCYWKHRVRFSVY